MAYCAPLFPPFLIEKLAPNFSFPPFISLCDLLLVLSNEQLENAFEYCQSWEYRLESFRKWSFLYLFLVEIEILGLYISKTQIEEKAVILILVGTYSTNEHVNCTLSCKFKLKRVHETIRFEMGHFAKKNGAEKLRSSNLNAGTSCQVLDY